MDFFCKQIGTWIAKCGLSSSGGSSGKTFWTPGQACRDPGARTPIGWSRIPSYVEMSENKVTLNCLSIKKNHRLTLSDMKRLGRSLRPRSQGMLLLNSLGSKLSNETQLWYRNNCCRLMIILSNNLCKLFRKKDCQYVSTKYKK